VIDFYRHTREAQEHIDSMMRAARRGDTQSAIAIGRLAMMSVECALRELPETMSDRKETT
jgi:hypothetical protein